MYIAAWRKRDLKSSRQGMLRCFYIRLFLHSRCCTEIQKKSKWIAIQATTRKRAVEYGVDINTSNGGGWNAGSEGHLSDESLGLEFCYQMRLLDDNQTHW